MSCLIQVNGTAVGFISISTNINTSILKENFELDVFNHFLKKIEKKIPGKIEMRLPCTHLQYLESSQNGSFF